jgi:hypothetical protein
MEMTKEKLAKGYPELVREIEEVGFKRGQAETGKQAIPTPEKQTGSSLSKEKVSTEEGVKALAEIKRLQLASGDPRFLKKFWDEDPGIRAEFRSFEAFAGYAKNRDRIQIIGGRTIGG